MPVQYAGTAGTGGPKNGWGHSTFAEAAKLAKEAEALAKASIYQATSEKEAWKAQEIH